MEEALRAAIIQVAGSPSLIGERVYPVKLPQKPTLPAVTYQVISGPRRYTQDGKAQPTTFRVQVEFWAHTYEAARQLRDVILLALSGERFEGLGSPPCTLQRIFVDNERDVYQAALDRVGPEMFGKSHDLFVTAELY